MFLIESLPPWHTNRLSRLIKTPKLHVGDTGLACALLGLTATSLMADRALLGQVLETFVFQELRRQASWRDDSIRFFHFRDKDGAEVDIVLERSAREVAGVEVKTGATVTARLPRFTEATRCGRRAVPRRRGALRRRGQRPVRRWPLCRADPQALGAFVMSRARRDPLRDRGALPEAPA